METISVVSPAYMLEIAEYLREQAANSDGAGLGPTEAELCAMALEALAAALTGAQQKLA